MNVQDKLIKKLATRECKRISTSVIRRLQKYKGDCLLSGDDSVLANSWDEICVQVQNDRSFHWDAYYVTVEQLVEEEINNLDGETQTAIWFQTEKGYFWEEDEDDKPDTVFSDIVGYIIQEYILEVASRWSNWRIRHYLETRC